MAYFFDQDDIRELRREIPAQAALKYTCPEIRKNSILCPNPEHNDSHYGNCKLLKHGRIRCFACNREFSALDLLIWEGYSFYEAACILADESGHPEDFMASNREKQKVRKVTLSAEDRKFLGLSQTPWIEAVKNGSLDKPDKGMFKKITSYQEQNGILESDTEYLILEKPFNPWRELQKDHETFLWLIRNKCKEVMAKCVLYGNLIDDSSILEEYKRTYNRAEELYLKHGGILGGTSQLMSAVSNTYKAFQSV